MARGLAAYPERESLPVKTIALLVVAQLVEHLTLNQSCDGSSPSH